MLFRSLNEQRSDEERHLAELEERMRKTGRRKPGQEGEENRGAADETQDQDSTSDESSPSGKPDRDADRHIDFTA